MCQRDTFQQRGFCESEAPETLVRQLQIRNLNAIQSVSSVITLPPALKLLMTNVYSNWYGSTRQIYKRELARPNSILIDGDKFEAHIAR